MIESVKLIESVNRVKNLTTIIATVEDANQNQYLGKCKFFLPESDVLPEDEDDLCYFLEDLNLEWVNEYSSCDETSEVIQPLLK
jgi:hypothetical protein